MNYLPVYNATGSAETAYNNVISNGNWRVTRTTHSNQYRSVCFSSYDIALPFARISPSLNAQITGISAEDSDYDIIIKYIPGVIAYRINKDTRSDQGTPPINYYVNILSTRTYSYNGYNYMFIYQSTGARYSIGDATFEVTGLYNVPLVTSFADLITEVGLTPISAPITYRLTNCTAPTAPAEATIGDTVTVNYTFPDGYGIANSSDIYVTNNGVLVPSTYSDGTLTFTMPDPS